MNLAVGREGGGSGRQPGSTFKPVLLAETVKEGYSVESSFPGPGKITIPKASNGADWNVANFEDAAYGRVNLIDATKNSINTVYAQLAVAIGATHIRDMAKELGVTTPTQAGQLAGARHRRGVGHGHGRRLLHLRQPGSAHPAAGNSAHRNGRRHRRAGLHQARPQAVLTEEQADVVNFCLRQVVERGSGTGAKVVGKSTIGKTGDHPGLRATRGSSGTRAKLTAAVWMGYPEGNSRKMDDFHGKPVTGGSYPATIFRRFMTAPRAA